MDGEILMGKNSGSKTLTLMWRFMTKPQRIGAICPSSRWLCRAMVNAIELESAEAVAELGPGTGVITREILRTKPREAQFFAVELDPRMCAGFQSSFPKVKTFQASAAELTRLCQEAEVARLDAVISGLPWAAFPESLQRAILDAILANLKPDGYFTTFAYLQGLMLPAGRRFRQLLHHYFAEVRTSRVVWANLPPAIVYRCHGPRKHNHNRENDV